MPKRPRGWSRLGLAVLLLLALAGAAWLWSGTPPARELVLKTRIRKAVLLSGGQPAAVRPLFHEALMRELAAAHVDTTLVTTEMVASDSTIERWEVPLPATQPPERVARAVTRAVERFGGRVQRPGGGKDLARIVAHPVPGLTADIALRARTRTRGAPRVALVVEQFGHHELAASQRLLEMREGISVAILPYTTGARDLARRCREAGAEVLVNLPMEGRDYPRVDPGPGAVLVDQEPRVIRKRVDDAIGQLDGASGVMPFLGALAVEDRDVMAAILEAVAAHGGYFVDCVPTPYSTVQPAATAAGVANVVLGPPLDGESMTEPQIRQALEALAGRARKEGWAAGRLRPYPATIEALRTIMAVWHRDGIELVPLSEVVAVPR